MKIEVQHIPSNGTTLIYRKGANEFSVLDEMAAQDECRFNEPIDIELKVIPEKDLIKVKGCVSTIIQMTCSRCLLNFDLPIRQKFTLRFSKQIPSDINTEDDNVELTADQIGVIYFQGEEINFKDSIQEQVVLALPIKPLCTESCKGLCQQCGADLNTQPCGCEKYRSNSPFAVLTQKKWPSKPTES